MQKAILAYYKHTDKKLGHLTLAVLAGMFGISLSKDQSLLFWLLEVLSELCFDRDTFTCSRHIRGRQSH